MIQKSEIISIAALARLELSDSELDQFAKDLSKITAYIDRLAEAGLSASDVSDPLDGVTLEQLRRDEAAASMRDEDFLRNAPAVEAGYLKLPKVVE